MKNNNQATPTPATMLAVPYLHTLPNGQQAAATQYFATDQAAEAQAFAATNGHGQPQLAEVEQYFLAE